MNFRVMDESITLEGRGVLLFVNEGDDGAFADGCRIRDVRGAVHVVDQVTRQDGLTGLLLRRGDAIYFERLFRDVLVDATLFTLLESEG